MLNTNHLSSTYTSTNPIANNPNNNNLPNSTAPTSGDGKVANQILEAYHSGSITPTTQGRGSPIDLDLLVANLSMSTTSVTVSTNEKMTEANNSASVATPSANDTSANQATLSKVPYQKEIGTANATGPLIQRFAINPEAVRHHLGDPVENNEMHSVEVAAFKEALQELANRPSAEVYSQGPKDKYASNVVVMDIFATPEGKVKPDEKTGQPETHATVLWKKKEDEIVLFDPSNRTFSQRIKDAPRMGNGPNIMLASLPGNGNTVYGSKNGRDCIDIAVKIAFEVDEQQKKGTAVTEIEKKVIQQITNQPSLVEVPSNSLSKTQLQKQLQPQLNDRNRQSSDPAIREQFSTIQINETQSKPVNQSNRSAKPTKPANNINQTKPSEKKDDSTI